MKGIVYGKLGGSLLVVMVFAIWILTSRFLQDSWEYHFAASGLAAVAGFFLAACYLPDRQPATFLSRRSALGAMAFFAWLSSSNFSNTFFKGKSGLEPLADTTLRLFGPILITWLLYHLSYYLIRGFRAPQEIIPILEKGDEEPADGRTAHPETPITR